MSIDSSDADEETLDTQAYGPITVHAEVDSALFRNYRRFFIGGIFGFGLCVYICREVLHAIPPPVLPMVASAAAGVALAMFAVPRARIWCTLTIDDALRTLTFVDLRGTQVVVPTDEIEVVAGQAGLSGDGGEIIRWRWTRVIWPNQDIRLRTDAASENLYLQLLQRCPRAVGVSHKGDVHMPLSMRSSSLVAAGHARLIQSMLMRGARGSAVLGVALVSVSSIVLAILVAGRSSGKVDDESFAKAIMWLIVGAVLGVCSLAVAWRYWRRTRAVGAALSSMAFGKPDERTPLHLRVASDES